MAKCGIRWEKPPTPSFSLGRESVETYTQHSSFSEDFPKDWLLSHLFWSADLTGYTLVAWRLLRTKQSRTPYGYSKRPLVLLQETHGISEDDTDRDQWTLPEVLKKKKKKKHGGCIQCSGFSGGYRQTGFFLTC